MPASDVDSLLKPVDLVSEDKDAAFASVYALFFLMYFVILFYGMNVARSIIEEKTSRIFEVSARHHPPRRDDGRQGPGSRRRGPDPDRHMDRRRPSGREVGPPRSRRLLFDHAGSGRLLHPVLPFGLRPLLQRRRRTRGYDKLFRTRAAADEHVSHAAAHRLFARHPSRSQGCGRRRRSGLLVLSLLHAAHHVCAHRRASAAAWQIALSIVGLILTILAVLWFASRIYRVGILMYGKKPNLPEILRWLKYS